MNSLSGADFGVVNPSGIKSLLPNVMSTFFINGKQTFFNGPTSLPKNPPDYINLDICVFNNFKLTD